MGDVDETARMWKVNRTIHELVKDRVSYLYVSKVSAEFAIGLSSSRRRNLHGSSKVQARLCPWQWRCRVGTTFTLLSLTMAKVDVQVVTKWISILLREIIRPTKFLSFSLRKKVLVLKQWGSLLLLLDLSCFAHVQSRLLGILEEKSIQRGIIVFPGNMTPSARKVRPSISTQSSCNPDLYI